jgi:5'-nucleotidase
VKHRTRAAIVLLAALALVGTSCGTTDDDPAATPSTTAAPTSTTSATSAGDVLEILVTNDDGYASKGIDAVVEALRAEPGTHVTVVAPYEVKTASGYDALGVEGFPADTVILALGELGLHPDLVVSGTNEGQNIGPFTEISGTVGAAKQAVRTGVPAFASSTGTVKDHPYDHAVAAKIVAEWVRDHRKALLAGTAPVEIRNLNVPTCATGKLRGIVEVPLATDFKGRNAAAIDCTSAKPRSELVDDVDAFANGFAAITLAPAG